jgi:hypothetical protein
MVQSVQLRTFRNKVSVPSSMVKRSKKSDLVHEGQDSMKLRFVVHFCFLLGMLTRISFYLSSPPGSEPSTASRSCMDVWKLEQNYLEATGCGLVTYCLAQFLRRVNVIFVMQTHNFFLFHKGFLLWRIGERTVHVCLCYLYWGVTVDCYFYFS